MNTHTSTIGRTKKMAMLAMLSAIIIVLQIACTFIKFGPFSITLALTPIIVGAAIYGVGAGAFLGFVLGAVIFISGIWFDGSLVPMIEYNFIATVVLCFIKTIAAGAVAGLVYKLIAKKNAVAASLVAGVVTPVINTGIFAIGMMSIFYGYLSNTYEAMIANPDVIVPGNSPIGFLYLGVIGLNFVVEFIANIALATVITRVVSYYNVRMK